MAKERINEQEILKKHNWTYNDHAELLPVTTNDITDILDKYCADISDNSLIVDLQDIFLYRYDAKYLLEEINGWWRHYICTFLEDPQYALEENRSRLCQYNLGLNSFAYIVFEYWDEHPEITVSTDALFHMIAIVRNLLRNKTDEFFEKYEVVFDK